MLRLPDVPVANACHLAASGAIIPAWGLIQVHQGTGEGSISATAAESACADGSPLQFDSDRSHRLKRLNKTSLYDIGQLRQVGRRSALNPAIIIMNRWLAAAGIIQVAPCHRCRRDAESSLTECPASGEHVST